MESGLHRDSEPVAKKPRTSHHKKQMSAYCYCGRCRGKIIQRPRTIDDHRIRYPRRSPSPEPDIGDKTGDIALSLPNHVQPSPDSPPSPIQHGVPVGVAILEQALDSMRASSPLDDELPALHNYRSKNHARTEDGEGDALLDAAEEIDREYPFDQLLDEPADDPHHYQAELGEDLGYDEERGDEDDRQDDLYDEDFGLAEGEVQHPEFAPPRFQFTIDEEPLPEAQDELANEPVDNDEPEAQCAAFQEPSLIRNAYIDAFIQKSLYGATHRALKHQLRSARRTIAAHPDIRDEDIAKMAQTIQTVERRLGVHTGNIITTFTLCPLCRRRYSPQYIAETDNNECLNQNCPGVLFTVHKLASGGRRKVSNLTYPFASPIAWIGHILSLAGMAELIQNWRTNDDDNEELTAPVPCDTWFQNLEVNKPIGDMPEGWGWRSTEAGLASAKTACAHEHPVS